MFDARCSSCGSVRKRFEFRCGSCGSIFEIRPDWKYRGNDRDDFPYVKKWISLGETTTPMVTRNGVSLKLDYFSPTYSYKDRGSRVMISRAQDFLEKGSTVNEDSSGNAGASVSAYGVAAGFKVNIFASGNSNETKIRQIRSYGGDAHFVTGSREDVARAAMSAEGTYLGHAYIPEFRDGIRSLAYEIFRQTEGNLPDAIYLPLSAGSLLLGMHSGFRHLMESGEIDSIPAFIAVQPDGVDPICSRVNSKEYDPDNGKTSIADALVTRRPVLMKLVVAAIGKNGSCVSVNDAEIMAAWRNLSESGFLVEYSSAAAYAGIMKKRFGDRPLVILTGNGLKSI